MTTTHRHKVVLMALLLVALTAAASYAVETEEAIIALVRQTYQLDSEQYEIELRSNQLSTRMVDPADLTLRTLSQKEPLGLFTMIAEINHDGERIDRGQVRVYIRKFAQMVVATDNVGRHQELTEGKFTLIRIDITNLREKPVMTLDEIAGYRSKRNLRKGTALTQAAIEPLPAIELGGEVEITFTENWGSITAPGKALEDGWIGEPVRVKNLATGKVIKGKVVSEKSVEVNP